MKVCRWLFKGQDVLKPRIKVEEASASVSLIKMRVLETSSASRSAGSRENESNDNSSIIGFWCAFYSFSTDGFFSYLGNDRC